MKGSLSTRKGNIPQELQAQRGADTEVGTALLQIKVIEKKTASFLEPKSDPPSEPKEKENTTPKEDASFLEPKRNQPSEPKEKKNTTPKENNSLKEAETREKDEVTVTSHPEPPKEVGAFVNEEIIVEAVEPIEVGAAEVSDFDVIMPSDEELDDIEIDSTETPLGNAHIEEEKQRKKDGEKYENNRMLAKTGGLRNRLVFSVYGLFVLLLLYCVLFLKRKKRVC